MPNHSLSSVQLVRQQTNSLQKEHRQGSRRGEYVRGEKGCSRSQSIWDAGGSRSGNAQLSGHVAWTGGSAPYGRPVRCPTGCPVQSATDVFLVPVFRRFANTAPCFKPRLTSPSHPLAPFDVHLLYLSRICQTMNHRPRRPNPNRIMCV